MGVWHQCRSVDLQGDCGTKDWSKILRGSSQNLFMDAEPLPVWKVLLVQRGSGRVEQLTEPVNQHHHSCRFSRPESVLPVQTQAMGVLMDRLLNWDVFLRV